MWLRNKFNAKLAGGSFWGYEFTEYRLLIKQLEKDYSKRDLFVAKSGYWLMVTAILYQWALLNSFSVTELIYDIVIMK